ncbi:DUF262 domain-containing protein [Belliella aquatica]|uniref:DUF262 domain-containing protein n=1 Tax=Belliella aquatica TaxID=1323734 RepID=A0ABQ1N489_9BACT|nr:DUF262 domain-containing protein [Belliella aquatica]MCH7407408.1 DUF262 domain-containing HNH endonuclease family protein [Belliella aquatica]GGC53153.1 hypothetical protein GCM10010993_34510 [Belliella aquatica]
MTDSIHTYSIREIFDSGEYVIPIYQRNYAWGEPEISQLIQDIYDYAVSEKRTSNYYIGTLVVYERHHENKKVIYETIDGQQRLTTLNILVSALNRLFKDQIDNLIPHKLNLFFDSRRKSSEALEVISRESKKLQEDSSKDYNPAIIQAYKVIEKSLKKLLSKTSEIIDFYDYLADKVHLMRVSVPGDTDLNHYFEIMNTRGEQLEKHEILKAKLLEFLYDDEKLSYAFNLIWEACADMERYVQYGFNVEQRDAVFTKGKWNEFTCYTLEEVADLVYPKMSSSENDSGFFKGGILEIVEFAEKIETKEGQKEDAPERFTSIINFSNFLLHVLRIQTEEEGVALDDKRLLDTFFAQLRKQDEPISFVKEFGFNLLWCKWAFDNYIIKREFIGEKDQWSLKRLKWYKGRGNENRVSYVNTFGGEEESGGVNKELIMLLSMFHVSTPTLVYKHWLNAALSYIFYYDYDQHTSINSTDYIEYLKNLAKSFLFDRYLAKPSKTIDFYNIIYLLNAEPQNQNKPKNLDLSKLDTGTEVENIIFNYLDFLLWKKGTAGSEKFEFAFRSSVEHYYPQNPIAKDHKIDQDLCDHFGNLCLISSSKNSRLSNHMPEAKKDYYFKAGIDSLKQSLMMKESVWDEATILKHGEEMKNLLIFH